MGRALVKTEYYSMVFLLIFTGCAVTSKEANQITQDKNDSASELLNRAKIQLEQEGYIKHVQGNFLGDIPIDLPYSSKLPALFFRI